MVTYIIDREAPALKTTEGVTESVASALGLGQHIQKIGAVSVATFGALPPAARGAFTHNGIDTMEKFADLTAAQAQETLQEEQVSGVGAGDVAEAAAIAKTLLKLK